jgi:C_GCAxxG_C_C family probable redox protein
LWRTGLKERAKELYFDGYVCAESIVMAAAEEGRVPEEYVRLATGFGQGMVSGCVCGALAGAQMVIGAIYGRTTANQDPTACAEKAKSLVDEFKKTYRVTCCRALGGKLERGSPEQKEACSGIVEHVAGILDGLLAETPEQTTPPRPLPS